LSEQGEAEFLSLFSGFLRDYGCRGFTREPYYPRWSEAPEYVFDILKSLVADEGSDLLAVEEKNAAERNRVEGELKKSIGAQRYGAIKLKLLNTIIGTARRYIVFREEQRYNLDKWITMNRLLYLKIGELLTIQGRLAEPSDVFFLGKKEIKSLNMENPEDLASLIKQRRVEFQRYENITPPKFMEGDREYNDPYPPSARSYKGIPASQGVLTGPVRVLNSITEIWRVKAGEILVVPRTDPGWTPVFSKIGGLITETGGVLSHGAVVSREYGVPAVTNISNACRIFQTGQIVTITGATGSVSMDD
jgi:pyruvate,water dikinase